MALGDDHTFGAGFRYDEVGRHRMGFVLERQHGPLADPHALEQKLGVSADQLRTPGDVGIDPLEPAIVQRNDIVLNRFDQPKALQFSQFIGFLCGEIMRLSPVVGAVKLPHVVVERWRGIGLPRGAVLGNCRPTLMVDAAVTHHLEVLHFVGFLRFRVTQCAQHADALQRRLRDPVHRRVGEFLPPPESLARRR